MDDTVVSADAVVVAGCDKRWQADPARGQAERLMAEEQPWRRPAPDGAEIALEIVQRVPRDLVFVMRFLGESPHRLMRHFQGFIRTETARRGATPEDYPLLAHFVDLHAAELRDFVLAGTALTRQFRAEEIERLTGDSTGLLRLDIWDALKSHVEAAERRFLIGAEDLPRMLATMGVDRRPGVGRR